MRTKFILITTLSATAHCFCLTCSSAQTFTNLWNQTDNPSGLGNDMATAITADASGIYVAGYDMTQGSTDAQWRIEKRDLTTGALVAAFGTSGVVTSNPSANYDEAFAITADASGIYVAGWDQSLGTTNAQWRIEKRDLTTGALIAAFGTAGVVTSNPSAGEDIAYAITAGAGGIYVAGWDEGPGAGTQNYQWRIEKRNLTTGALIWTQTTNPSVSLDQVYDVTVDASGIYVAGRDDSPGNGQWRIEKRDLGTGALIASFGTAGVITENPSNVNINYYDHPAAITADAGAIYIAGYDMTQGIGNLQWRIEKRDLTTGALITAFGTGGIVTTNPSPAYDMASAIIADASGIYVAGYDNNPGNGQWLIEKRDLTTGALLCTQASNPSSDYDMASAITADASGIYVTGGDQSSGWSKQRWRIEKYDLCGTSALNVTATSINPLCNGVCSGTAVSSPSGGTIPYTYSWNNGQTTSSITGLCAGTYTVTVTDAAPTTVTATVSIIQPPVLTATATAANSTCGGSDGTAGATASGGTPSYTYSWSPGGQTTQTATGLAAGTYTATVSDANNCSATQTVTVVSSGNVTSTSQSAGICSGTTYTLPGGTVVSTGGVYNDTVTSATGCDSIITTTLTVDSVFNTNQSSSICPGSTYTLPGGAVVSTGGTYNDTLVAVNGCDSIITTNLTVNSNLSAAAFSNTTITQGQSVTLTASGGGTYSWNNGESGSIITVTPPNTTIYCVTVMDANNCTDTACVTVTIEPIDCSNAGELYIPNAFSPNGDGENDVLKSYYGNMKCIKTFQLRIYNRWGEKVFTTTNPIEEWDGFYKGKPQNTAVFVYYLAATLLSGEEIIRKGNMSILR